MAEATYALFASISPELSADFKQSAKAQLAAATAGLDQTVHLKVDVDKGATDSVRSLGSAAAGAGPSLGGLAGFGLSASGAMTALQVAGVALSPVLLAVASSAALAGASAAAAGPALLGAASAFGAGKLAFGGISQALKLYDTTQKTSTTTTAASASTVIRANESVQRSQESLTRAREAAIRNLEDLKNKVDDIALSEEDNSIRVARAKENLDRVNSDFTSSDLDRREAAQQYKRALDDQGDSHRDNIKLQQDYNTAQKKGVNGADQVVAATQSLVDAQKQLADATTKTSATQSQLDQMLAQHSPAFRTLYSQLIGVKTRVADFGNTVETVTLPGFSKLLTNLDDTSGRFGSVFDIAKRSVLGMGITMSTTASKIGDFAKTPFFKGALTKIVNTNNAAFKDLGVTAVSLLKPVTSIFLGASPLVLRMTGYVKNLATTFANWIDRLGQSKIDGFFKRSGDELFKWFGIARDLGSIVLSVFKASLPTGSDLVTRIGQFTHHLSVLAASPEGEKRITDFFNFFKGIDYGKLAKTVGLTIGVLGAFKLASFGAASPIMGMLGILSTQFPTQTAWVIEHAASGLAGIVDLAAKHPREFATITALLIGLKGLQTIGKIKMSFGDIFKSFGGKTGVMSVQAAVVNVNGGVGGGLGKTGKVATTAEAATVGAVGTEAGAAAVGGASLAATVATVLAQIVAPALVGFFGDKLLNKLLPKDTGQAARGGIGIGTGAATGAAAGAGIGAIFGGVGAGPGAIIGAVMGGIGAALNDPAQASALWHSITDGFSTYVVSPVGNFFTSTLPNFVSTSIPNAFITANSDVEGTIQGLGIRLVDTIRGVPNFITQTAPQWFATIPGWFNDQVAKPVGSWVAGLPRFFSSTAPHFFSNVWSWFVQQVVDPINSWISAIPNAVGNAFSWVGSLFGIDSAEVSSQRKRVAGRAMGGMLPEGLTMVGEKGPELARKTGSNVDIIPNTKISNYAPVNNNATHNKEITYNVTVNNPVPEKASISVPQALRRQQYLLGSV
jgi:predicted  nucleic acid-binding Zn-ribbon protein